MTNIIRLDQGSEEIKYLSKKDKHMAKVFQLIGPLEYSVVENGYSFLVSQIIGQMLSNKVGDVMYDRLLKICNNEINCPTINQLSDEDIKTIGISNSKVQYIRNLSKAITNGTIDLNEYPNMTNEEVIKSLTSIKGIGNWSAKMYLIFALDRRDVLPYEDVAFLQGYGWVFKTDDYSKKSVEKKCKKWGAYSSIAARYLYIALDQGFTKSPFHLFK